MGTNKNLKIKKKTVFFHTFFTLKKKIEIFTIGGV